MISTIKNYCTWLQVLFFQLFDIDFYIVNIVITVIIMFKNRIKRINARTCVFTFMKMICTVWTVVDVDLIVDVWQEIEPVNFSSVVNWFKLYWS